MIDTIDINHIRFTDSYQSINQYQFLAIDCSGFLLDHNALPFSWHLATSVAREIQKTKRRVIVLLLSSPYSESQSYFIVPVCLVCIFCGSPVFLGTCTSRLIILLLCDLRVFKFLPCISFVGTALNLDRPVFFLSWQVKTSFSITFMGYYTSENNCTGQWRCQITGHRYNIKGSPDLAAGPPGCASPVFLIGLPLCNTWTLS